MADTQTPRDLPAITRETMDSAIETLTSRCGSADTSIIPQAVYLDQLPSYDDFFAKFLVPNQLCILSESATRHWRSRREWVREDGSPNFDFLQQAFGESTVPIANCKHKEFSSHAKQEMKMSAFLTYWQNFREAGHPPGDESLYLKDWHFTRAFPDYKAYCTCSFFQSDWMNEFWDVRDDIDDDYRFVYMGPKGTWTPFHADVFRSFSWSANICGRKRWIFFPPGEEEHLKDQHGNLAYDVMSKELEDPHKFPNACKAQHRIDIIQHPGETIFVPSGWHHQVENLEDTISINHNWLNGCNVQLCWAHIKASLADVQQEISDCRDMDGWDQQCQRILRAFVGLDYCEFFRFMLSISKRRMQALKAWKQRAKSSSSSRPSCCSDFAASQSSAAGVVAEGRTGEANGRRESDIWHDDPHRNCKGLVNSHESSKNHSELKTETERQKTKQASSETEEERSNSCCCHQNNPTNPVGEGMTLCGKTLRSHEMLFSPVDSVSVHLKHMHIPLWSDQHEGDTKCVMWDASGFCASSVGNPPKQARVSVGASQPQPAAFSSMLDLSGSSEVAGSDITPHWSYCNVYHALFDLDSVAMVLKDMIQTTELSALLCIDRSGKDEGGPRQDRDDPKFEQVDKGESAHLEQGNDERDIEQDVDDLKPGQLDKNGSDQEQGKDTYNLEQGTDDLKLEQLDGDDSDLEQDKNMHDPGEDESDQGPDTGSLKNEQLDKGDVHVLDPGEGDILDPESLLREISHTLTEFGVKFS